LEAQYLASNARRKLVAKKEWGTKRQCMSCGARFYDLNNSKIVCPECETVFVPEALLKSKRWQASDSSRQNVVAKPEAEAPKADTEEVLADNTEDVEDNENSNDTLLADDEDDGVSSVIASKPSIGGES
jgi:uncharacterized protein (TIGR02300 family)